MDIRDEVITGSYLIGIDGRKEPIDWRRYSIELEAYIEKLRQYNVLCSNDYPVVWQGKRYKKIIKFDLQIVKLGFESNGFGDYFTVIPISPKKYREEKGPTKAGVVISEFAGWTLFRIYSDWGECYEMNIHNSLKTEIEAAKLAAIEQGLLLNE